MRLILDANIVMAALIADSTTRKILFLSDLEFISLKFLKSEINKHKAELLNKMHVTESELQEAIDLVMNRIEIIEDAAVKSKLSEAKEIMNNIDPDDAKYVALALAVENDGIWSDDNHFTKQSKISIWKSRDIVNLL